MILFRGIEELLTLEGVKQKAARKIVESDLAIVKKGALVVEPSGRIQFAGEFKKLPSQLRKKIKKEINLASATVMPAFIECHTHSIFAGERSVEFEARNQGVPYQKIAAEGGGIRSTMRATRAASAKELKELLREFIQDFSRQGVTTLEIKTGYGLDQKNEIRCLQIIDDLNNDKKNPCDLVSTLLAAHALPPEFSTETEYLKHIREKILPSARKLTHRVDVFIENGFFSPTASREYLQNAKNLGFEIAIHADQLTLSGGSELAVELGALSADHVIQINPATVQNLARSEVTSVLLPTSDLYMKCKYPPARALIDQGARVALATDFNPGTAPSRDLSLVGLLARLEMKMSLPEVLGAYTVGAAYALNLHNDCGTLAQNMFANFLCSDESWSAFFYSAGHSPVSSVFRRGQKVFSHKLKMN